MKAIKKINNNFALCLDENGIEVIVYGKGVGFGSFPCELDLARIERTYYDVNPKYMGVLSDVSQEVILTCSDIVDEAQLEIDSDLNPNLVFTLADHINFAIERFNKGIEISTPLAYDIKYLYPKEMQLGISGLAIIKQQLGICLPDCEAASIAMHLINAEGSDLHASMKVMEMIEDVCEIIEKDLQITLDKDSYSYSRFAVHLHNLINRISNDEKVESGTAGMLKVLAIQNPDIYFCANQVADYFNEQYGWKCNKEEVLYLMLHISRVKE